MDADPTHVRLLVQTRPWLRAVALLLGLACLVEGVRAARTLASLGPMPDDPYLAGRWSIDLVAAPTHVVLTIGSGLLVAGMVAQIATIGQLAQGGRQDELLAVLRHVQRFWRWATVAVLSALGVGCAGGMLGFVLGLRRLAAILQEIP